MERKINVVVIILLILQVISFVTILGVVSYLGFISQKGLSLKTVFFLMIFGVLHLVAMIGIFQERKWGKILSVVLIIFTITIVIGFPLYLGLALGGLG